MELHVTWSGNVISVPAQYRRRGINYLGHVTFDFDAHRVSRGGLLEEALTQYDLPICRIVADQTFLSLKTLTSIPEVTNILSAPTSRLRREQILTLFRSIEDFIGDLPSVKEKNAISTQMRRIYLRHRLPMSSGDTIADIGFVSKFPSRMSYQYKAGKKGLLNQDRIILAEHESEKSLQENVLKILKKDLKEIEDACWTTIEKYKAAASRFREIKTRIFKEESAYLKGRRKFWSRGDYSDEAQIADQLYDIEKQKLYMYENSAQRTLGESSVLYEFFALQRKTPLASELRYLGHSLHQDYFLDYFMPVSVVEAAEILFLICTHGWNLDAVVSITPSHIKRLGTSAFHIDTVKGKNDQVFDTIVYKNENPRFFELIELLLVHNQNADKYWKRKDDSIFSTWSKHKNGYRFKITPPGTHIKYLIKPYGLNYFSKKQLRDQAANILYLETDDPFLVQETLGHANLATTLGYLNQHIIRLLHEANIRRFQDRLAATVVWVTGGEDKVKGRGLRTQDIDKKLLFPVSNNDPAKSAICDEWIRSLGEMKFTIGPDEIKHLNWQARYYRENYQRLRQNNPKALLLYHLPRILFCLAMQRLVADSPYSKLLEYTESGT